jgi:IstB-like ATP binding protein
VPVKGWHEVIGDPTLADAICDRLVHSAYMIDLQGPSLRDPAVRGQAGPAPPSETGPAEATESSPPKPPRPRKRG